MKFLLPLRFGFRAARRHPKLVLLLYLVSLAPALVTASLAWSDLAPELNHSVFAERALEGQRYAVWSDYLRADGSDFGLVTSLLLALALLTFVAQVLAAAGLVEALLQREHHREHPFLLGIGRHGWRFVRSTLWFLLAVLVLAILLGAAFGAVNELAEGQRSGLYQLWGWLAVLALGALLYVPLDLALDLSRIASATHEDRRTLVGFFKALGHACRHPLILLPVWLAFVLPVLGLHLAYLAARFSFEPENLGWILAVLVAQQLVFLLAAFFRVGLWGAQVAYYQAAGEPRWCGRKLRKAPVEAGEPAEPVATVEREPEVPDRSVAGE